MNCTNIDPRSSLRSRGKTETGFKDSLIELPLDLIILKSATINQFSLAGALASRSILFFLWPVSPEGKKVFSFGVSQQDFAVQQTADSQTGST
jgi:hypothetical protein